MEERTVETDGLLPELFFVCVVGIIDGTEHHLFPKNTSWWKCMLADSFCSPDPTLVFVGAGDLDDWLGQLSALVEGLSSIPSSHIMQLTNHLSLQLQGIQYPLLTS